MRGRASVTTLSSTCLTERVEGTKDDQEASHSVVLTSTSMKVSGVGMLRFRGKKPQETPTFGKVVLVITRCEKKHAIIDLTKKYSGTKPSSKHKSVL